MNKTNKQLADEVIDYINKTMQTSDILELAYGANSTLGITRTDNIWKIVQEYLNSFAFTYHFRYLNNGHTLIFNNRAEYSVLHSGQFDFDNHIYGIQ